MIGVSVVALKFVATERVRPHYRGQVPHLAESRRLRGSSLGGPARTLLKDRAEQDGVVRTTIASIHYAPKMKKDPAGVAISLDVDQMRANGAT